MKYRILDNAGNLLEEKVLYHAYGVIYYVIFYVTSYKLIELNTGREIENFITNDVLVLEKLIF